MKTQKTAFFLSVILLALAINTHAAAAKVLYVQVRSGEVRANPNHLGKLLGSIPAGESVKVLETKGAWIKISATSGDLSGWMHSSLLNRKKISMAAGDADAELAASQGEMSLATKGFSADAEKAFKQKNPEVDYSVVDKMENKKVSEKEIVEFMQQGEVTPPEGQ